jgi:26S proteasome non-ATPase regulatory subunit 10
MSSSRPLVAEVSQDLFSTEDTIQQASYAGNLPLVEILRKQGFKITDRDDDGRTPFHWAVAGNHTHLLRHFLSVDDENAAAVVNAKDDAGWTPLHSAVSSGYVEIASILLESDADPNLTTRQKRNPLHYVKGNVEVARVLVSHCSTECLNARDEVGSTPLCRAATLGHLAVATVLLQAGANINLADNEGNGPLHLACEECLKEMATLLLKAGAREDVQNRSGKTPVELAPGALKSLLLEA